MRGSPWNSGRNASVLAVAATLLGLAGQGVSALHLVLVEHSVCAEHHAVVEGADETARVAQDPIAAASGPIRAVWRDGGSTIPESTALHNHCTAAVDRSRRVVLAPTGAALPAHVAAALQLRASQVDLRPSRTALLLAAPKASPPA